MVLSSIPVFTKNSGSFEEIPLNVVVSFPLPLFKERAVGTGSTYVSVRGGRGVIWSSIVGPDNSKNDELLSLKPPLKSFGLPSCLDLGIQRCTIYWDLM